jgi:hypothetical protein
MTSAHDSIPEHCGFDCPHAAFPPAETAGICRTMSAVLCGKLDELVSKNTRCEWRRRGSDSAASARSKPKRRRAT